MRHVSQQGLDLWMNLSNNPPPQVAQTELMAQPIELFVAAHEEEMKSRRKPSAPKTIHDEMFNIRRTLRVAGITTLQGLQVRPVKRAIDEIGREDDLAAATLNHYVGAITKFSERLSDPLLFETPPLKFDPLAALKRYKADGDRRLIRAALTPEQFRQLVDATLASKEVPYRVPPEERAAAYAAGGMTGMRKGEIRGLTAQDCKLWDSDPHFVLRDGTTKNRRSRIVRPGPDYLPLLRNHCRGKVGNALLFRFPKNECDDVRMLRVDLAAASINPFVLLGSGLHDEQIDWHAFRVSFVTWLLMQGASVPEVMAEIGHRSEKMVMHYARLLEQQRRRTPQRLAGLFGLSA